MAFTRVQTGTIDEETSNTTSHVCPVPGTPTEDNLLIHLGIYDKDAGTLTADTSNGWSLIGAASQSNNQCSIAAQWKLATDSEGANVTMTTGNSILSRSRVLEYSYAGTLSLVGGDNDYDGANVTTVNCGSVSGLTASDVMLALRWFGNDTGWNDNSVSTITGTQIDEDFANIFGVPGICMSEDLDLGATSAAGSVSLNGTGDAMVGGLIIFKEIPAATGPSLLTLLGVG